MKLELKCVQKIEETSWDIQIRNKSNKNPGLSGWNLSKHGIEDFIAQLELIIGELKYHTETSS